MTYSWVRLPRPCMADHRIDTSSPGAQERSLTDLGNRPLVIACGLTLVASVAGAGAVGLLDAEWTRAGSALLQSLAIIGSLLLVVAALAALAKRARAPGRWHFRRHVELACLGLGLVSLHAGGGLDHPPALLLLALLALMALGVWARTSGAARMAATFGTKRGALAAPDANLRRQIQDVIDAKRALLSTLAPEASEALFSLELRHWLRQPRASARYHGLVRREHRLLGTSTSVSPAQAHWRWIHRLLSVAFVLGLLVHVVLVTFFAGYVAEGRPIYWWHLAAWGG